MGVKAYPGAVASGRLGNIGKYGADCFRITDAWYKMGAFMLGALRIYTNAVLVVVLDYIAAFGVLGFAGGIYRALGKKRYAIALSGFLVTVMRYVCHILSGILIWGVYADEGQSVLSYSLLYNGGYMVPEIIITTVALALVAPFIEKNVQ